LIILYRHQTPSRVFFCFWHSSSRMCVGCFRSPESLTGVNSSGLSRLPPSCNSNYLGYISINSNIH
ncbi:hypothetical protein DVQ51_18795, partial [Yersinia enterocolitica]|nr:hypothetical protein [Yersinia enterocolitica]EKN6157231.1 hypothetical protein [Yersinia enterocolitica]